MVHRPFFAALAVLAGLCITLLAGCSSSRTPAPAPRGAPAAAPSAGPALALLYTTPSGNLALHDARAGTTATWARDAAYEGVQATSPDGAQLAFSYATADSARLAVLDLRSLEIRHVDARAQPTTYSLAWHPKDGRLAYGYYTPAEDGSRGPGSLRVARPDGSTRSVGCRAVREVLHWLPTGALAGRDEDTLYLVAPSDCATQASTDARRFNDPAYAPGGTELAYIYYELTYNRSTGQYQPDSSLYLSDPAGQSGTQLLGPERRVRHVRWSPDGTELAFDAQLDTTDRRQIAIYSLDTDRTVYLVPPGAAGRADQVQPRWSPSGTTVGFVHQSAQGRFAAARVQGQTRRFGRTAGPVHWIDEQTLAVPGPDSLRVTSLTGNVVHTQPAPAAVIHAWRLPAPQ